MRSKCVWRRRQVDARWLSAVLLRGNGRRRHVGSTMLPMPEDEYIYSYILFVFPRISIKMACPGDFEVFMLLSLARSVFFFSLALDK